MELLLLYGQKQISLYYIYKFENFDYLNVAFLSYKTFFLPFLCIYVFMDIHISHFVLLFSERFIPLSRQACLLVEHWLLSGALIVVINTECEGALALFGIFAGRISCNKHPSMRYLLLL